MNCFEIAHTGPEVPAVAVCARCGAGLCREHAITHPDHLMVTRPVNRRVRVQPPARRILCGVCTAAEAAAA